jgi:hypothetical protein
MPPTPKQVEIISAKTKQTALLARHYSEFPLFLPKLIAARFNYTKVTGRS